MVWTRQRRWHKGMERSWQVGMYLGGEPTALKDGLDVKVRQTKHQNDSRVPGCSSWIFGQPLTEMENPWEDEALTTNISTKVLHTFTIKHLV